MQARSLTTRERRILLVALAVAAMMLLSRGLPAVTELYRERAGEVESLRDDIARERRLIEQREQWRERRESIEQRREELGRQVFDQSAAPVLGAEIQRLVRGHAADSGVSVNAARLAESMQAQGWLLVEQTLSFTMDRQGAAVDFLERLQQSTPRLGITRFDLRRSRNQYSGDVTVVGFARTGGDDSDQQVAGP